MTLERDDLRPSIDSLHTPLRVDIDRPSPDVTFLRLNGDVDRGTQQLLAATLDHALDEWPPLILVSLEHVRHLASCGLNALIEAHQKATNQGNDLTLAAPNPMLAYVLSITGVDRIITVYHSTGPAEGLRQLG